MGAGPECRWECVGDIMFLFLVVAVGNPAMQGRGRWSVFVCFIAQNSKIVSFLFFVLVSGRTDCRIF